MKYISAAILVALFCASVQCFDDENIYANAIQDYADMIGKLTRGNNLGELWSQTQPKLQKHLDLWKNCPKDFTNTLSILGCKVREGAASYELIQDYLGQAKNINAEVFAQIEQGTRSKIAGLTEALNEYYELTRPQKMI